MEKVEGEALTEVWHYTSAAGLKGIIENDFLFACPATQMNDSKELHEGRDRVEQVLREHLLEDSMLLDEALSQIGTYEEILAESENLFLISASTDGDNLSLWRNYGASASYAIRLDPSKILRPIVNSDRLAGRLSREELPGNELSDPLPNAAATGSLDWLPVDYSGSSATEFAENIALGLQSKNLHEQSHQFVSDYRSRIFARTKHGSFVAESEVRRIIRVAPPLAFLGFREAPRGLMRHIRVGYTNSDQAGRSITGDGKELYDCISKHDKLPILEVKLSPTGHLGSAAHSLESFLSAHGYDRVRVSKSSSPFIG